LAQLSWHVRKQPLHDEQVRAPFNEKRKWARGKIYREGRSGILTIKTLKQSRLGYLPPRILHREDKDL